MGACPRSPSRPTCSLAWRPSTCAILVYLTMRWYALILCFNCLLRGGEITVKSATVWDSPTCLTRADITFDFEDGPD